MVMSHESQHYNIFGACIRGFFSIYLATVLLPWKPMALYSKLAHPQPACRVWSRSVEKRRRSCGTDKRTDKSKLQYDAWLKYVFDLFYTLQSQSPVKNILDKIIFVFLCQINIPSTFYQYIASDSRPKLKLSQIFFVQHPLALTNLGKGIACMSLT